ncbi:adenylate kinase [Nocardioides flavus (ex Wang et al. 2016)]|uniref:Adenylate kinase n=1 Tax=Nocardioides flavus (ex Wang et al. 2016) TaxID=2058780 RepID=A0ABQ3HS45_9ACTN|nr:4-amino-4-deoxy-L-arabinose transferase [Nocardioides flavus (ex Wang et al. 2016)]GHE19024.1 adenylate kinase [Nocardioides flavus (ex Wang et al. 2016)]
MAADPAQVAREVAACVLAAPPTLGSGRLVCVDGPAGSGKTTLAQAIVDVVPDADVVHCDDLLEGWGGLPGLAATVEALVRPLADGRPGEWRRWDWLADGWAETHIVRPGGLLVLEGVGSWSPAIADVVGLLVWVEAESGLRLTRGIARDGEAMRGHWLRFRIEEDRLFAEHRTRARADRIVATD